MEADVADVGSGERGSPRRLDGKDIPILKREDQTGRLFVADREKVKIFGQRRPIMRSGAKRSRCRFEKDFGSHVGEVA